MRANKLSFPNFQNPNEWIAPFTSLVCAHPPPSPRVSPITKSPTSSYFTHYHTHWVQSKGGSGMEKETVCKLHPSNKRSTDSHRNEMDLNGVTQDNYLNDVVLETAKKKKNCWLVPSRAAAAISCPFCQPTGSTLLSPREREEEEQLRGREGIERQRWQRLPQCLQCPG